MAKRRITVKRNRKARTSIKRNHVAFVFDESGSMAHLATRVRETANKLIGEIKAESERTGQETTVSFIKFANNAERVFNYRNPADAPLVDASNYCPHGLTAMFDGIELAVDTLKSAAYADDPDTSFLVIVVTDGHNNINDGKAADVARLLMDTQRTNRWTYAFQVPYGHKGVITRWGIPDDNVQEWEQTEHGFLRSASANSMGTTRYFDARSAGATQTMDFYVQPDLSKVSPTQIKRKLDDLSDRFRDFTVPTEDSVREFVERKTRKPFVVGSAYYQLMKPETVQKQKAVVLVEKGKKAVWGGAGARDIIGLPSGAGAQVVPGNHANYDIFVQSTSVNRRLPRGTRLLVDVGLGRGLKPTWDHVTAEREAERKRQLAGVS